MTMDNDPIVRRITVESFSPLTQEWHKELFWELPVGQEVLRDMLTVFMGLGTVAERNAREEFEQYRKAVKL